MATEPALEDERLFAYRGRSMWPLFQDGDVLVVRPLRRSPPRVGDCVVFVPDPRRPVVVHRIVGRSDGGYVTRGDAHAHDDDARLDARSILGVVRWRMRAGAVSGVSNGRRGLARSRLLRRAAGLNPARDSRGGRLARAVRRALQRPAAVAARHVVCVPQPYGDAEGAVRIELRGAVVAVRSGPPGDRRIEVYWPWTLLFTAQALGEAVSRRD